MDLYVNKANVLINGGVFEKDILESFKKAVCRQWAMELSERILNENTDMVRSCIKLHRGGEFTDYDEQMWGRINSWRIYLMKDSIKQKSLFTKIRDAISLKDYNQVSALQLEMSVKMKELRDLYAAYKRNIIDYQY